MPLIKINADGDRPVLDGLGDLDDALTAQLAALPPSAPVVVLVHGYKFSPVRPEHSPHTHILSLSPRQTCWKALSWPRHLGFGRGALSEGLCIAFGWEARGTIWQAWAQAEEAGRALAGLVARIRARRPDPVDLMGHSLGARVALTALAALPAGSVGRVLQLAAAEFQSTARTALESPAGRSAEVFNITTRENDLFDGLMEWVIRPPRPGDQALGAGLPDAPRQWLDVQLDHAGTRAALAGFGFDIPAPARRVCHWSAYLRPGVFPFYATLLRDRQRLPLATLRAALPDECAPRRSRLLPAIAPIPHLPASSLRP